MTIDCDVLVVGAGISGLTVAFELVRRGLRVEIVDEAPRTGGVIRTTTDRGVRYEHGPNSILDTHPAIGELLAALHIAAERVETRKEAATRYVVRAGRLVPLPMSPPAFVATSLFSARAKLRLFAEPFIARGAKSHEETVSEFVTRRLGRELLDYAVEPFVAGVYAGNPDELSVDAAFPRLRALENRYGSLIRGQIAGARERKASTERSRNSARSFSFRGGMQTLTDALTRALPRVRTETRALRLERAESERVIVDTTADQRFVARAIVLAVPAERAAALVQPFAPDAALALEAIPYAPVASVACAYPRSGVTHPLDGFGFLVPRVENRRILGSLFSSSTFDERAPHELVLLTTFVGGRRQPALALAPNHEIEQLVADELATFVGARELPALTAVTRWPRAIPQYTLGHLERIRRAEQAEAAVPGLFLCASYKGGVAVGDCIRSALATAARIIERLR